MGQNMGIKNVPEDYDGYKSIINNFMNADPPIIIKSKSANLITTAIMEMCFEKLYFLKWWSRVNFECLLDDDIREAVLLPRQNIIIRILVRINFFILSIINMFLIPPIPYNWRSCRTPEKEGEKPQWAIFGREYNKITGCPIKQLFENGYKIEELGNFSKDMG